MDTAEKSPQSGSDRVGAAASASAPEPPPPAAEPMSERPGRSSRAGDGEEKERGFCGLPKGCIIL